MDRGPQPGVVREACRFACKNWKLARITAHVFEFNVASARVLGKSGFEREGLLKKYYLKDGKFVDGIGYALVR